MSEEIKYNRCRFPGAATMTLAAAELGHFRSADAQPSVEGIAAACVQPTEARQTTGEVLHVDGGAHNERW